MTFIEESEENLDDELDGVIYQHRDLYCYIKDKYNYYSDNDLFTIGVTNLDTFIQVGYNYEDKHFMLCVMFNNISVYVCSFTQKTQFDLIIKTLVKKMIYNIRFYIYDFFLYLQLKLENKNKHELGYYNKVVNNMVNTNGVKVNYDLIAALKARNAENIDDVVVANNITIFQIDKLKNRKKELLERRKVLLKNKKCSKETLNTNKETIKEFSKIMEILNINI